MKRRSILSAISTMALAVGCGARQEIVQVTAEGRHATESQIDEDAFQLLPPGAVVWLRADAQALFEASFGDEVARFMKESLPFAEGAGVNPKDDVDSVIGAMFATVGSDVVGICRGRFHKDSTAQAIKNNPTSVMGKKIQSTEFAGATMYVVEQVAMSILTDRTMVFGTQLGVRRVLERVEEGRLKRTISSWYEALLTEGAADFQIGVDLDSQPIPATWGEKLRFMKGLRAARLLGNFRRPGLNLAGTLTYKTPLGASQAAEALEQIRDDLERYELILRALGMAQPFQDLQAQATDKDTQLVVKVEGDAVAKLLENSGQILAGVEAEDWLPN